MNHMIVVKAFKFRLKTTPEQERQFRRFAGSCRFVWNKALALQLENHKAGEKFKNHFSMNKWLPVWKKSPETIWLKEAPSQALQNAFIDLERAYKNFFEKRGGFPKFKKKGDRDGFRFPQGFKLDEANSRVFLPKLGWVNYFNSREIVGKPKNITVSQHCGQWFFSVQTEQEAAEPVHESQSSIGIDMGIDKFAALSDGTFLTAPRPYKRLQKRLARLQRNVSRKTKGSANRKKAVLRVSKLHRKISNIRRDFLQKSSTTICKNHALIVIEDLKTSRMSRSAEGTVEHHGRNVRAKSGLNRSILDQGWSEFRRMLEYKQAWLGGRVVAVRPHYTSQACSVCGVVDKNNRLTQARFACLSCGHTENADFNAAKNIHAAGYAVFACGGTALPLVT